MKMKKVHTGRKVVALLSLMLVLCLRWLVVCLFMSKSNARGVIEEEKVFFSLRLNALLTNSLV